MRASGVGQLDPRLTGALVGFALAGVFVTVSMLRLIDADEGMYLLAARLVMEGQLPYRDFAYPQMPVLPYLHAGWAALTGLSWQGARLLSALLATALGLAIHLHVARLTGRRAWGILAATLFAFNGLALAWLPVVKTYAIATLALFLATTALDTGWPWRYALSGILLGLAIDARLYVLAVVPLFVWAALRSGDAPASARAAQRWSRPRTSSQRGLSPAGRAGVRLQRRALPRDPVRARPGRGPPPEARSRPEHAGHQPGV